MSDFLRRLNDSENPAETFATIRAEGGKVVRRKLRHFSIQNYPASADSPPRTMTMERGELTVRFQTLEELAEAMLYLATVFTHDLDGFSRLYEPAPKISDEDVRALDEAQAEADFT